MTRGVVNTWEQLKEAVKLGIIEEGRAVAISYSAGDRFRCQGSHVWSPFFKTDSGAHWQDYGKKHFVGNRAQSLPAARAWAEENYGITAWKRNGMYDYVPAEVQAAVKLAKR